jgi:4-hydroxy-tetrahydrodipicolinate reductase
MADQVRIAILGVTGRMGKALIAAVEERADTIVSGGGTSSSSEWIGRELRALGANSAVRVSGDATAAIESAQAAIDFTLPEATSINLAACEKARCPLVIGTTGHDEATRAQIASAARIIPIVHAPNMSLGVNVLLSLVEQAARTLDEAYDVEIFEAHHRHKKDSPSGTALALGRAAAAGRGVSLEAVAEYDRHGTELARKGGAIGFSVFRGGDVVGDHTVSFAGIGERVELTHRASDRMAFARGAVVAAKWLLGRPAGLYSMKDVLGLK